MPEPQETMPEAPAPPKKKSRLGCLSIAVLILIIFSVGFLAGPIGQGMFKSANLPEWLSVDKPTPELPAETVFHLFDHPVVNRIVSAISLGHEQLQQANNGYPVSNSIIATWLTMIVLIGFSLLVTRNMREIPRRWQTVFEFILGSLLDFCNNIAGKKNGRRFFPIVATIFLFVIFNGWLGLFPVFGSIGVINITLEGLNSLAEDVKHLNLSHEAEDTLLSPLDKALESLSEGNQEETVHQWEAFIEIAEEERGHGLTGEQTDELIAEAKKMEPHLLRPANTDINTPLAIALISFVSVLYFGFKDQRLNFLKQYFNFGKSLKGLGLLARGKVGAGLGGFFLGIIDIFIGIVELLSLLVRNVSFTLRLFGNMTAGEILLLMVTFLVPFFAALPFYGLELLVGFVQALIFSSLTLIFLTMAVTSHEQHGEEKRH